MSECVSCHKSASELDEYIELTEDEGYESAEEAVKYEEGTYNSENEHFLCTECYIKNGMPLGVAP